MDGMAKAMLRLPCLLSPANPAIAGEGPLSPPTPQGAPSRSHHPCRRLAVPAQSCSSPAVCRSRVFTEFLVSSMRCTTVVPPRDDYSMTGTTTVLLLLHCYCPLQLLGRRRRQMELLWWQMLLAFTTDGQGETARASSAASERALVAGRAQGRGQRSVGRVCLVCLSGAWASLSSTSWRVQ